MSEKISNTVKNHGMSFDESLAAFLRSRKLGNGGANKPCGDRTLYEYKYDLQRFFKHFVSKSHYNQITEQGVLGFLDYWQSKELSQDSKNKLLRSLRAFFNWVAQDTECKKCGMLPWDDLLPKISKSQGRIYVPTPEVMRSFLDAFDTRFIWGLRDFVVTCILIDCGPRIGEICNLTTESILWNQNRLLVNGKTGPRVVPINADITVPNLRRWLREREGRTSTNSLFITKFGDQCRPNTFDQSFADARAKSGVGSSEEGTLTPHTVRHYFCTHYLINGGSLSGLKAITGHMSLETLQIYLHMAEQLSFVAKEHAEASPLQSLGKRAVRKRNTGVGSARRASA
jgi:site-specific recombinase XerD